MQLSANLTEKTSVRPVAPKIASMSGRLRVRPSPAAAATTPSSPRTVTTPLPAGLVLGADFVTPAVDTPLRFHLSASGRRLRPASDERDPPDDSLAGAGLFTSRSAAIAIAPAGLAGRRVRRLEGRMLRASAHFRRFVHISPYFAFHHTQGFEEPFWGRLTPGPLLGVDGSNNADR